MFLATVRGAQCDRKRKSSLYRMVKDNDEAKNFFASVVDSVKLFEHDLKDLKVKFKFLDVTVAHLILNIYVVSTDALIF